jgi:hypothetical protein
MQDRRPPKVKSSKSQIHSHVYRIPELQFEDQRLTSFSGLILFQALFQKLELKERLRQCFRHLNVSPIFGHHVVMLWVVVHLLLGFRRFRDSDYYHDDPIVCRALGVRKVPDVSTLSRTLSSADQKSFDQTRNLSKDLVMNRLVEEALARVTLDFDGSVQSTKRHAEGSAVGYNKKKKGARSYYPLFCTVAQTGQFLDFLHRPGNVHDSNGSIDFMIGCFDTVDDSMPTAKIETRSDSAFFSDKTVQMMDGRGVEFTISVPFERFAILKQMIEDRQRWNVLDGRWSFFESDWKPESWDEKYRFIFIRQQVHKQTKEPLQLDLFIPINHDYDYKVIVTNKTSGAKKVLEFHNGRGAQENIIGEAKDDMHLDYIPMRTLIGNQLFCTASVLAHNLGRELQMQAYERDRGTTEKRSSLWVFEKMNTLRRNLIQRAGRLTRPRGKLTLTLSANRASKDGIEHFLSSLDKNVA